MIDKSSIIACKDFNNRTCIQVERDNGRVKYIPLDISEEFKVCKASSAEFDQKYKPMVNYPIERAVQLYLGYARNIGITKEALDFLGHIVDISNKELLMAVTNKRQAAANTAKEKRASTAAKEKRAEATRRTVDNIDKPTKAGRRAVDPVAKPAKAASGEKRESAAQMFQNLIMEGKLTDDKIFAKVQEKFGLDDSKRSYVKWYRSHLTKQGKNPPVAK